MKPTIKFIPLSFITSNDEIIRHIKNTVVFSHLFESCNETTFRNYIETTQYGFTASALENGSHRMLRITDIHHSKVNWESVPFCDCPDDEKYLLKDNDILVARTGGTTGKSFFVEDPPSNAVFASYLIRIRLKEGVNIDFINAFLNSYCFWSQIVEMKAGSAQPNVNAEKLKTLVMPDCDSATQAKTVRLIKEQDSSDSIQERINEVETLFWNNNKISTELERQLDLVKELRQAYLREAMQGKLVPQDGADEPAEILLEKIKAEKEKLVAEGRIKQAKPLPPINPEELPFEIPSNWAWCRLGEIVLFSEAGSSFRCVDREVVPNEWGVVKTSSVTSGVFVEKENKFYSANEPADISKQVKLGDFLFCRASGSKGLAGKSCIVGKISHCLLLSDKTIRFRFSDSIESKLIGFYNNSMFGEDYYNSLNTGKSTTMNNVTRPQIYSMPYPLPPLAEQERIVAKLEKLMKFCDELEANIKQGITNADRLLQTALKEALAPK